MAKFTDYTQKTKPADADLLLIHDNAGAANKKTPFSGVWSWILDKLASAVISQLETTNKSIIPAINELNSKTEINALIPTLTVDFNNPPKHYIFHANSTSTNIPRGMGNQFIVLNSIINNDMYGGMLVIGFGESKIAYKSKNNSNTWSNWKYINFTNGNDFSVYGGNS